MKNVYDDSRTAVITTRTTAEEKNRIMEMAKKRNLSVSEYVRLVLMREIEKDTPSAEEKMDDDRDSYSYWIKNGLI